MSAPTNAWNSANPDTPVTFQKLPSKAEYFSKLSAATGAGSGAPDVVQVDYSSIPFSAVEKLVRDVSSDTADLKSQFPQAAWSQVQLAGGTYGVPQDIAPMVLFYRKDLFDANGLKAPTTWAEYETAARTLKAALPQSFMCSFASNGAAWLAGLCWQDGARWFEAQNSAWKVDLDDTQSLEVAKFWQSLIDEKLVKGDQNWQPAWFKGLADGTYLTWIGPSWGTAALKTNAPDLAGKWAVAPLPQWESGADTAAYWGGSALSVTAASTKPAAALKFITWLNTSEEAATLLNTELGVYLASRNGSNIKAFATPDAYFGGQVLNDVYDANSKANPWTWGPTQTDTEAAVNDGLQKVLNAATTVPQVLANAETTTKTSLTNKGLAVV
ncbi:ABC transporter substrate-binding protein [Kineococcus rhizosphaerae]|uniref:Carbohydrate ABC transporter substrate-binding protein (CUT1 family) n=1 Tax=Kineococcus rhizosphaerae TaxID=559628 RepID=A0A2T0QR79_9ACTN|nr:extracellular solute-binding protein [Kineococcus rhizosphaerae]PRY07333.1 carbohydrate ABC transporter substrate-binding protein (CUT1 family) [Kineococcus rhizosphaerae]